MNVAWSIDRFWSKVRVTDGCWEWTGARNRGGYGHLNLGRCFVSVHRFAWELEHRRPFPDGLHGLHVCDNPPCCRPDHVFPGDDADNAHDAISKGRSWGRRRNPAATSKSTQWRRGREAAGLPVDYQRTAARRNA